MKFLSDIRLLLVSIWLGSAVFFIGVAQSAFAVLPQRELAGAIVNRNLAILNFGGLAISILLLLTSFIAVSRVGAVSRWLERVMLIVIGVSCAVGEFVIGFWLSSLRNQMGRPIDEVAADDPLRIQFATLHEWSVWVLFAGMIAALIAFFVIANRKFVDTKTAGADVYDFKKEFKI